jgi:hypothetical protein
MSPSPLIRIGDVLVALEGRARLSWRADPTTGWMPAALWPDRAQGERVRRHIAEGRPMLIVMTGAADSVPLLEEQRDGMPTSLVPFVRDVPGDLPALCIPALDWLPDDLRQRGLKFVVCSADSLPDALQAPLILENTDPAMPNVRFAHRLAPCPHLRRDLPAIVTHTFPMPTEGLAA